MAAKLTSLRAFSNFGLLSSTLSRDCCFSLRRIAVTASPKTKTKRNQTPPGKERKGKPQQLVSSRVRPASSRGVRVVIHEGHVLFSHQTETTGRQRFVNSCNSEGDGVRSEAAAIWVLLKASVLM